MSLASAHTDPLLLIQAMANRMEADGFAIRADGLPHGGIPQSALTKDECDTRQALVRLAMAYVVLANIERRTSEGGTP